MQTTMDDTVTAIRSGDLEAYAEVVQQYQHDVWRIVSYALAGTQATEDLVQEVFVQAWFAIDRLQPGRDIGPWLRTIARNVVRKELRRQIRERRRVTTYHERLVARMSHDEADDPRDAELRAALQACREKLPEKTREALTLRYDRGLDFAAVAAALDRTVAAARQLLTRARASLRECVQTRLRADAQS